LQSTQDGLALRVASTLERRTRALLALRGESGNS